MHRSTIAILACPVCFSRLALARDEGGEDVESGVLQCIACDRDYPVLRGIPRFAPDRNYAENFGLQWNLFRRTQLDSYTGQPVSRSRFLHYTGWAGEDMADALTLDVGCGAGRFAEVAATMGARVIAVDFSTAIDAARENLRHVDNVDFVQADLNALPFAPRTFRRVYCLGVIQHTPDPERSFQALATVTAPGGALVLDVYPAHWKNWFFAKYWIRPLTTRMRPETQLAVLRRIFPALYALSRLLCRIPVAGHYLRYLIPVANYTNVYPLDRRQLREWALLDTFDMWAAVYDQPQSKATIRRWFEKAGFDRIEVFHAGFFVGRGVKPER